MSYPLHQNTLRGTSQLSEACVSLLTFSAAKFHLDEFVVRQRTLSLSNDRRRYPMLADQQDGIE